MTVEFAHTEVLFAGLAVAGALCLALRRRRRAVPYPILGMLPPGAGRKAYAGVPALLAALAAAMFVAAGAGPRAPVDELETKVMGVDVMLAVDLSLSMLAEDLKPNRMVAARETVMEFAKGYTGGRLGLVAFSGRSFTQCPLTTDTGLVAELVDQLGVGAIKIDGTAIGDAILNSINRLGEESGTRIIVLLTDGENNQGADPMAAAAAATERGIKIYSIAVGTAEGAPVPRFVMNGKKFYLRNQDGSVFMSRADEDTLRSIAEITGGRFFRAEDPRALIEIYRRIAEMEKKEIIVKKTGVYRELFQYPAGAGLMLLMLAAGLQAGRLRRL